MKALFNNKIIAESNDTIVVEGNHYFPHDSIVQDYFKATDLKTTCPWKGLASYYTVAVDDQTADNAAWYYASPNDAAAQIKNYVAFYPIVQVSE